MSTPQRRGPWHEDICFYCKKRGHWKKNCSVRKQDKWKKDFFGGISVIPATCNHLASWSYDTTYHRYIVQTCACNYHQTYLIPEGSSYNGYYGYHKPTDYY
jgi:hypothetical protein